MQHRSELFPRCFELFPNRFENGENDVVRGSFGVGGFLFDVGSWRFVLAKAKGFLSQRHGGFFLAKAQRSKGFFVFVLPRYEASQRIGLMGLLRPLEVLCDLDVLY